MEPLVLPLLAICLASKNGDDNRNPLNENNGKTFYLKK
jgi:hypothetical protein